ncbi:hypothetical protein Tco_0482371, partial [Tanacetum coccineum]
MRIRWIIRAHNAPHKSSHQLRYTPFVTYPEEVEETIGIPMEVEPLDHMKLEDLSLDTSTHDLFLSSKGFP